MSHKGKTQITMVFTAPPDLATDGERLFTTHADWLEKTHHRDGKLALLSYDVAKGPELSNSLDPSSTPTGKTCFALTEVYESAAGLDDHWKQAAESWSDFGAFVEWAGRVDIAVLHGSPVIHSLW